MATASDSHRSRKQLVRILKGVLNLAFLYPDLEQLESEAEDHPTKLATPVVGFHSTPEMRQQFLSRGDPEFRELRDTLKKRMSYHQEFHRARAILKSVQRSDPGFDWELVIESRPNPIKIKANALMTTRWEFNPADRKFLKSLKISAEESQEQPNPDRKT